jgi:hypothetical protein
MRWKSLPRILVPSSANFPLADLPRWVRSRDRSQFSAPYPLPEARGLTVDSSQRTNKRNQYGGRQSTAGGFSGEQVSSRGRRHCRNVAGTEHAVQLRTTPSREFLVSFHNFQSADRSGEVKLSSMSLSIPWLLNVMCFFTTRYIQHNFTEFLNFVHIHWHTPFLFMPKATVFRPKTLTNNLINKI